MLTYWLHFFGLTHKNLHLILEILGAIQRSKCKLDKGHNQNFDCTMDRGPSQKEQPKGPKSKM
jgi:hypothetical protein